MKRLRSATGWMVGFLALATGLAGSSALGTPVYRAEDISITLGATQGWLNDRGELAYTGTHQGVNGTYIRRNGRIVSVGPYTPLSFNNAGQLLVSNGTSKYIWDEGTLTPVPDWAQRMNDNGVVVGFIDLGPDPDFPNTGGDDIVYQRKFQAVLHQAGVTQVVSEFHIPVTLDYSSWGEVEAVYLSNSNQITGNMYGDRGIAAIRITDGVLTTPLAQGGGFLSYVEGKFNSANELGQAVGYFLGDIPPYEPQLIVDPYTRYPLGTNGGQYGFVYDINNLGDAVANEWYSDWFDTGRDGAALITASETWHLDDLLDPEAQSAGIRLGTAFAINDLGDILSWGSYRDPQGDYRGNGLFLLTTRFSGGAVVPEPGTLVMAGIGGVFLLGWRLRKRRV